MRLLILNCNELPFKDERTLLFDFNAKLFYSLLKEKNIISYSPVKVKWEKLFWSSFEKHVAKQLQKGQLQPLRCFNAVMNI